MPKRSELKLTKRTVDALEADGKDVLFWDRELAGLGVRVHTTGRKTWETVKVSTFTVSETGLAYACSRLAGHCFQSGE